MPGSHRAVELDLVLECEGVSIALVEAALLAAGGRESPPAGAGDSFRIGSIVIGAGIALLTGVILSLASSGENLSVSAVACLLPNDKLNSAGALSLEFPRVRVPGGGGNNGLAVASGDGL